MAKATIPLATKFDPDYFKHGIVIMEKYDGVPIRVRLAGGKVVETSTRAGKPLTRSTEHIVQTVEEVFGYTFPDREFVMEVLHPTVHTFKDVSGMVRKDAPCPELYAVVFDMSGDEDFSYRYRSYCKFLMEPRGAVRPPLSCTTTVETLERDKDFILAVSNTPEEYFEGWIVRCSQDPYIPNKRQKGYQKLVIEPTVDLRIVGFEEAVDGKTDEGKGMVGRIIAEYKGKEIGVGPGKMSHHARTSIWQNFCKYGMIVFNTDIAEIKYKRDPSYDALRQPTFQHWRDDKTEPNEETI